MVMRSYNQYCPIARGAEIFATRWTPIIVRNLLVGCRTFTEILAGAPGIPRSLLSERLRQLEQYGIVCKLAAAEGRGTVYELTQAGRDLGRVCDALGEWGERWVEVGPRHLDPYFSLWSLCKEIEANGLPEKRLTVRFDFSKVRADDRHFWLVVQRPEPEVCVKHPGFEEDLIVRTDPRALVDWRLGVVPLKAAVRDGAIEIDGAPAMIRKLELLAQG